MKLYTIRLLILLAGSTFFSACEQHDKTLFTRLSESETGITFRNLLKEDNPNFNITLYPYFYNGGGVAVGDVNNDGLNDIFFSGNLVKNRLLLNEGDMEFDDITEKSHVAEKEGWCTGATMVDINVDGWLDIYVCRSALENHTYRKNLLFINNHDLTFTERAAEFGLDDMGYSTQAAFFDFDHDEDLDVILINQSLPKYSQGRVDYVQLRDQSLDSAYRNKLFRNDNGKFIDVSSQAGIHSNVLTFSLGVSTSDINLDGWPDIYITNDFKEPDHYYINNHNGTFTESLTKTIDNTSLYSMGIDVADYNNDLLPDIIVLDMLAESNHAQKMHMGGDNYTQYNYLFKQGMFYQYMKNSLQKNNGDGTFSEIGQFAGVSNTDWSWSPLLADFDNDGMKDLFITNGYKRDNTDIEFIVYSMNQSIRIQEGGDAVNVAEYISHMPGIHLPNYIFKNAGNDKFENKIKEWGFDHNTFSHGAAYADLDNDGDLDLITNNTDEYAGVYRNNSETLTGNNFLRIALKGTSNNIFGIGAKIFLYAGNQKIFLEQNPVRGFQSSSDPVLHAGLGQITKVDSLRIVWPDQTSQNLVNIPTNQLLILERKNAHEPFKVNPEVSPLFVEEPDLVEYHHQEYEYNDFLIQFLLLNDYSHQGPSLAKADVNNDGLEDFFIGGAKGKASKIFIQTQDHRFVPSKNPDLEADLTENTDAAFFDADNDKDQDLYIVSGGYSAAEKSPLFQDRLYLNNGKGFFTKTKSRIPQHLTNKKSIAPADIDSDGDIDLFIGGHVKPRSYPLFESSQILINDGTGRFTDLTDQFYSNVKNLGIVNDAAWSDINNDGKVDLLIAAEWQPIRLFFNSGKSLVEADSSFLNNVGSGLWTSILTHDFDRDGDQDIVAGNYGWNSQLKVDTKHPLKIYYSDFDGNGSIDPIITHYVGDKAYPLVPRDDLNGQMPILKKKFNDYKIYADASINEILKPEQLANSSVSSVNNLSTVYLENTGNGYMLRSLPYETQFAPVYTILAGDFNNDSREDLILAGNQSHNRIYLGKHEANHGMVLTGDGKGEFKYLPQNQSGLSLKGDTKGSVIIKGAVIFGINNSRVKAYKLQF